MDNKQGDIIQAVEQCLRRNGCSSCENCPYTHVGDGFECREKLRDDIIALLKAQEPRVMTLEEVIALPYGYVLIETDKEGSLRWVDALLFCKNTNFSFDFITLEGRARLLGAEYNKEWRCWTSRPDRRTKGG